MHWRTPRVSSLPDRGCTASQGLLLKILYPLAGIPARGYRDRLGDLDGLTDQRFGDAGGARNRDAAELDVLHSAREGLEDVRSDAAGSDRDVLARARSEKRPAEGALGGHEVDVVGVARAAGVGTGVSRAEKRGGQVLDGDDRDRVDSGAVDQQVLRRAERRKRLRAAPIEEARRVDRAHLRLRDDLELALEVADLHVGVLLGLDVVPLPLAVEALLRSEVGAVAKVGDIRDELVREHLVHEDRSDREFREIVFRVRLGNRGTVDAGLASDLRVDRLRDVDLLSGEFLESDVAVALGLGLRVFGDVADVLEAELVAIAGNRPAAEGRRSETIVADHRLRVGLDPVAALFLVAADVLLDVLFGHRESEHLGVADRTDGGLGALALELAAEDVKDIEVERLDAGGRVNDHERTGDVLRAGLEGAFLTVGDELAVGLVDVTGRTRSTILRGHHVAAAGHHRVVDEHVAVPDVLDVGAELDAGLEDPAQL